MCACLNCLSPIWMEYRLGLDHQNVYLSNATTYLFIYFVTMRQKITPRICIEACEAMRHIVMVPFCVFMCLFVFACVSAC